jgi:uncharacterized protein
VDETASIARTRAGYAAFAAGDLDALREMFAPDIAWHVPGRSALAGTYTGTDAVLGYFVRLFEVSSGTAAVELIACAELAPGVVAAHARITGDMPGGRLESEMVTIFREDAEGRTCEATTFSADQYAVDEATGPRAIALPDARTPAEPVTAP